MAFHELRQFKIRPGCVQDGLRRMQTEILPRQVACGMIIAGSFRKEPDDNVDVWPHRFENGAHREAQYAAIHGSQNWKPVSNQGVVCLIERETIQAQRLGPTHLSVLK